MRRGSAQDCPVFPAGGFFSREPLPDAGGDEAPLEEEAPPDVADEVTSRALSWRLEANSSPWSLVYEYWLGGSALPRMTTEIGSERPSGDPGVRR